MYDREAFVADLLFALTLSRGSIEAEVVLVNGDQDASASTGIPNSVWVKIRGDAEPTIARFEADANLEMLTEGLLVGLERRKGEWWVVGSGGAETIARLGGTGGSTVTLPPTIPDGSITSAKLDGPVLLEYGGTEANLSATGAGHLVQAATGAALSVILDNFTATTAPTVNDDSGDGYAVGSWWLDQTNDNVYVCIDATLTAAVWLQLNGGGSSYWTESSGLLYPNNTTDKVVIGSTSSVGKFGVVGVANEIQAVIRGNATQTASVLEVQTNAAASLFAVGTSEIVVNDAGADVDFRAEGDTLSNLFVVNAGLDRVGISTLSPSALLHIDGNSDEEQFRVDAAPGQSLAGIMLVRNAAGSPLLAIANTTLAISNSAVTINSGNGDFDTSISGDTDTTLFVVDAGNDSIGIGTGTPTAWLHLKASTTARATLRFPTGTAPTSPNAGDAWHDSTYSSLRGYFDSMTETFRGTLFSQTTETGNSNVTSEISQFGTGVGTRTIPANYFVAGKALLIHCSGYYQTNGSRDVTWRFKAGSTTLATQTKAAHSSGGSSTVGRFWGGWLMLRCVTAGASGTFWVQGYLQLHNGEFVILNNDTTVTLDTTASQAIDLTVQFATTSSTTKSFGTNVDITKAA